MAADAQVFIAKILSLVKDRDFTQIPALIAPGAVLNTPRHFKPITDVRHFAAVLLIVPQVIDGFHYSRTWAQGDTALMEFKGTIGGKLIHGLDIFVLNDDSRVQELTVFLRPTTAHAILGEAEDRLILAELQK
ncbi:MAG TPA: hypothetical protein VGG27_05985 [Magnetospirillaceae bacterium]|jgi:hypothetical protein